MPQKSPLPPAVLLFLRVMAAVFAAEALVMFLLAWLLPPLGDWLKALVDSTFLTLLITPLLWRWLVVGDRQRRRAEEELRKLSSAVKQTSNCVLITDRKGVIEYVNPAFERTTGYAREEVIGKTSRVFKSGKHDQKSFESLWNTVLTGGTFFAEIINRKKSGELYYTEQTISSIPDTHGHITHFVSSGRDITERKRAEQATLEQFKLSETFFNHSVSCLVVLDKNFNFLRVNAAYARACRRDISEFAGRNHFDMYPSDIKPIFEEVVRTKQPFTTFTRAFVFPDQPKRGVTHWDWTLVPILDQQGAVEYLVFSLNEVTERKRAEDALRDSEVRYRAIVEDQNELICRWNFTNGVTFINEAGCRYLSLPRSEILGRSFEPYVYEEDRPALQAHFASLKPEASIGGSEHRVRLPTGELRWTQWTDRAFFDAAGCLLEFQSVGRDITERKRAEAALRALSLQLSRAEDAERRRIARELHDSTGQKLAALSMTVGMLQDTPGAPAGKSEKMLADCLATIEQCAQEIRTLSYLLHPPLLDELGLAAAIHNYVEGFSKRSGVQVALDAPPDLERLPDEVEIALFRIVQESLGNIHRHAGASTARLRLACGAEQVTLEVSDQGRGMSAQTIRAIEAGRGAAGVGIAGMRERLRLLGGRLAIESGGQGTTMRAIVPRRQEPT